MPGGSPIGEWHGVDLETSSCLFHVALGIGSYDVADEYGINIENTGWYIKLCIEPLVSAGVTGALGPGARWPCERSAVEGGARWDPAASAVNRLEH